MKVLQRLTLAALFGILVIGGLHAADQNFFAPKSTQKLDFGCVPSCSQQTSSAFNSQTRYVRVIANGATAYINFAASGGTLIVTAATGIFLPVGLPEIFRVPGSGKLGVLAGSTTGSVWITELD